MTRENMVEMIMVVVIMVEVMTDVEVMENIPVKLSKHHTSCIVQL